MLILGQVIAFIGFIIIGIGYVQPRFLPELAYIPVFGTQLTTVLGLIIIVIGMLLFIRSIKSSK